MSDRLTHSPSDRVHQPTADHRDLPLRMYEGANRYDTDDSHVLHLWADGQSWDIVIPKVALTDLRERVAYQHHRVETVTQDGDDWTGCVCGEPNNDCLVLALIDDAIAAQKGAR